MTSSEWVRRVLVGVLMLPAYLVVGTKAIWERTRHGFRRRLGNPSRRSGCCDTLPVAYPRGRPVMQIPDLAARLQPVGTVDGGYTRWFACTVCGQEWREDSESVGDHGELPHVRKVV